MLDVTVSFKRLVDFRLQVYVSFTFRADALFELVEALLLSPIIRSAVEVSQSPAFRRRFPSVYDALDNGRIDPPALRKVLLAAEPDDALTVGGYAVYALDTTIAARPDAQTVPDRSKVYCAERGKAVPGHQLSWLGRVLALGQSWFALRDLQRVPTSSTPGEVGAEQVKRLAADATPSISKVVVVDSHYAGPPFLRAFVGLAPPWWSSRRVWPAIGSCMAHHHRQLVSPVGPASTGRSWRCEPRETPSDTRQCACWATRCA